MITRQGQTFGQLLRAYRTAADLTQEALAERAHLSPRTVSDIERGVKTVPHRDTVQLVSEALGLSADEQAALEAMIPRRRGPPRQYDALATPSVPAPGLVGRASERGRIQRYLAGDGPPVLLLAGEPGIGKTRLLQEASWLAPGYGWDVIQGGCQRRSGQEAYAPVPDALAQQIERLSPQDLHRALSGCGWLVRLLPELMDVAGAPFPLGSLVPEQERRLVFAAVSRFLSNVAGSRGTLLVLDDLQWAGADALALLASLFSHGATRLHLIGAYRDTEVGPEAPLTEMLADIVRSGLARQIPLGPLEMLEAEELLANLLPDGAEADSQLRRHLLERAEGVPYFLLSCAQGMATSDEVPADLTEGIRQRGAALPADAQQVLEVAAVAGRVVPRALLRAVAGSTEERLVDALDALCWARLLVEEGDRHYRFPHDVIREVTEAGLSAARRAWLHGRIARALEEETGEPAVEALADHYQRSDQRQKAELYLERAGDRAREQYAHAGAEGYYRDLVELLDGTAERPRLARALEKLAAVLVLEARYDAGQAILERAAEIYRARNDLEGLGRVTAQIGHVCLVAGWTTDKTVRRLQAMLVPLEIGPPTPAIADIHSCLATLFFLSGRYPEQLAAAERAVSLATAVADDRLLTEAQLYRGGALLQLGRIDDALAVFEALVARVKSSDDLSQRSEIHGWLTIAYIHKGEMARGGWHAEQAVAIAETLGDPWQISVRTGVLGFHAFLTGDWNDAYHYYDQALVQGEHSRSPYALFELGWLQLAEGAWQDARKSLEACIAAVGPSGNLQPLRFAGGLLAELDILEGHPIAALDRLAPLLDRPGLHELDVTLLLPRLAWGHLEMDDRDLARTTITQAVERARRQHHYLALAHALHIQGIIMAREGRREDAEFAFTEAVTLCRDMPYPLAEARALYEHGLLHMHTEKQTHARTFLLDALTVFQRLGARRFAEDTARALVEIDHG